MMTLHRQTEQRLYARLANQIIVMLILQAVFCIINSRYGFCECDNVGGAVSTVPDAVSYKAGWRPPVQLTSPLAGPAVGCNLTYHETIVNVLHYEISEVSDINLGTGWNLWYWSTQTENAFFVEPPACDGNPHSATYCIVHIYPKSVAVQNTITITE